MRSLNAETPRQPTAVYTMYDFFSFRRRHVSITNLKRGHNSLEIHSCIYLYMDKEKSVTVSNTTIHDIIKGNKEIQSP